MADAVITITTLSIAFCIGWKYIYRYWFINSRYFYVWKKIDKHNNILRILSVIMCLVCIGLYFGIRYPIAFKNVIDYDLFSDPESTEFKSANLSVVLMLDFCSMMSLAILFAKIFDNKHKYLLKPLSYITILGGILTIYFTIFSTYKEDHLGNPRAWDAYYFFFTSKTIGYTEPDAPLTFIMHYWMIIVALHTIVWETKMTWKDFLILLSYLSVYVLYIVIMANVLNIQTHVTALVQGDYQVLGEGYYKNHYNPDPKYEPSPSYLWFSNIYGASRWQLTAVYTWFTFALFVAVIASTRRLTWYLFDKEPIILDNYAFENVSNKRKNIFYRKNKTSSVSESNQ